MIKKVALDRIRLAKAEEVASKSLREAIEKLEAEAKLSNRDTGYLLKLSRQRIQQLKG